MKIASFGKIILTYSGKNIYKRRTGDKKSSGFMDNRRRAMDKPMDSKQPTGLSTALKSPVSHKLHGFDDGFARLNATMRFARLNATKMLQLHWQVK